jgi:hypothetical protein
MPNKNPLLGWHPPAELSQWVRGYAATFGLSLSDALTECVEGARNSREGGPITIMRGQEAHANRGAVVHAREGTVIHLPGGALVTVGRRGQLEIGHDGKLSETAAAKEGQ